MQSGRERHQDQKRYQDKVRQEIILLSKETTHFHPPCQKNWQKKSADPKAHAVSFYPVTNRMENNSCSQRKYSRKLDNIKTLVFYLMSVNF